MRLQSMLALFLLAASPAAIERQLTQSPGGHLLHNRQCFSPDDRFLYYDARNDDTKLGDSRSIGRVELATGKEEMLYRTDHAAVGAVTCHPKLERLAFIHGLANVSAEQPYSVERRCAASLTADGTMIHLDARDVTAPFTPGSLRGGTHAFHWSPSGKMLSFTHNDALVPQLSAPDDLRTIGVMLADAPVTVADPDTAIDFSGTCTAALLVPVTPNPRAGSDEILRAFDEDWLDDRTIAFQGIVVTATGEKITELFLADLPADFLASIPAADAPAGRMPAPLKGVTIRRLTRTEGVKYPGIQGPRHWVRASPDGKLVAFLAKDDTGIAQIYAIPRNGTTPRQISHLAQAVEGTIDWSPDGRHLACSASGCIQWIDVASGEAKSLTQPASDRSAPLYSVVFSRKGDLIAFNRLVLHEGGGSFVQIHVVPVPTE